MTMLMACSTATPPSPQPYNYSYHYYCCLLLLFFGRDCHYDPYRLLEVLISSVFKVQCSALFLDGRLEKRWGVHRNYYSAITAPCLGKMMIYHLFLACPSFRRRKLKEEEQISTIHHPNDTIDNLLFSSSYYHKEMTSQTRNLQWVFKTYFEVHS